MNETDYRKNVSLLMNPATDFEQRLDNFALGLAGEAAEVAQLLLDVLSTVSTCIKSMKY